MVHPLSIRETAPLCDPPGAWTRIARGTVRVRPGTEVVIVPLRSDCGEVSK